MGGKLCNGAESGGGANISGLESGVGNKLQERTRKWGRGIFQN